MMKMFFIVGVQRSGTTLLSVMLEKHPTVLMEKKAISFRIVTCFKNLYELLPYNIQHDKKAFVKWLIKNDDKGSLAELIDYENIDQYATIRELIKGSIVKKIESENKVIWGDKAPNLQHYLSDLLLLIPEAKILHIVRDGRANAYSTSKRSYRDLRLSAQQWVDGNIFGIVNQDILGTSQYKMIHYENLLQNPEQESRSICTFLGIPYASEMISLSGDDLGDKKSYVKNFFDKSKIDKWKTQLSADEVRQVENIQGPLLKKMGYDLMTKSEQLSFKQLSLRRRIWLNQKDNVKQLFRRKRKGMRDKKEIEFNIPLKNRVHTFLRFLTQDLLSRSIFKSLFSHFFYKDKFYKEDGFASKD